MSVFAVSGDRDDHQVVRRVSGRAVLGTFAAGQLRFGSEVTNTYLAVAPIWLVTPWLTLRHEFRKLLNIGADLAAAFAVVSYAIKTQLSRAAENPSFALRLAHQLQDLLSTGWEVGGSVAGSRRRSLPRQSCTALLLA